MRKKRIKVLKKRDLLRSYYLDRDFLILVLSVLLFNALSMYGVHRAEGYPKDLL